MKHPPNKLATPTEAEAANPNTPYTSTTMSTLSFNAQAAQAERHANELLAAWCEHGTEQCHLEPELFPTARHQEIARRVILATEGGEKGWAEVCTRFLDDENLRRSFIEAVQEQVVPTTRAGAKRLVDSIRAFHYEKTKVEIGQRIAKKLESGDPVDGELSKLHELQKQADGPRTSLRERAYQFAFDPKQIPPPDEVCLKIGEYPIAASGNLTVIQGKSKVGKSSATSAVLGSAQRGTHYATGDTLALDWVKDSNGAIIHLDTEQSRHDWHTSVCNSIKRGGMPEVCPRLISLPLIMFNRSERMEILKQAMLYEAERFGSVDLVVIDGVADLCQSTNDEQEALEVVSQLMALAQEHSTAIICVLHENPGSDSGKTRGHLGSELNRKAFANVRIDKDNESAVSTIWGMDMRKRGIPKEQGFCFAWDNDAGMHTFKGRADGVKAANAELKKTENYRKDWRAIYDRANQIGTNQGCPSLSVDEVIEVMRDMDGTENPPSHEAIKKRMQRAERVGVLKKKDAGRWTLT